jgi:hypothetical protein
MAYGYNYPMAYQPTAAYPQNQYMQPYQSNQPMVQPQTSQAQPKINNIFAWVQGEAAAKAYPIEPNTRLMAMDTEENVFYIKSCDSSGYPSPLEIYDFYKRNPQSDVVVSNSSYQSGMSAMNTDNLATKDDIQSLREEIHSIRQTVPTVGGDENGK